MLEVVDDVDVAFCCRKTEAFVVLRIRENKAIIFFVFFSKASAVPGVLVGFFVFSFASFPSVE